MTAKNPNILTEIYPVRFHEVDARGRLSIVSLCQSLSEDQPIFYHSIVRESDRQELVRAKTVWKELT